MFFPSLQVLKKKIRITRVGVEGGKMKCCIFIILIPRGVIACDFWLALDIYKACPDISAKDSVLVLRNNVIIGGKDICV